VSDGPRKYSPEERQTVTAEALDAIKGGKFLSVFCRESGHKYTTVAEWLMDDPETAGEYARARAKGYTKRLEEMEDDAEKLVKDIREGALPDPGPSIAAFRELRETRKWNAGKFARTIFGDQLSLEHSGAVKTSSDFDLSKLSAEDLATLRAMQAKAAPDAPSVD
jgi:hypothetical protein